MTYTIPYPGWADTVLTSDSTPLSIIELAKSRADEPDEISSLLQAGAQLTGGEKIAIGYTALVAV